MWLTERGAAVGGDTILGKGAKVLWDGSVVELEMDGKRKFRGSESLSVCVCEEKGTEERGSVG